MVNEEVEGLRVRKNDAKISTTAAAELVVVVAEVAFDDVVKSVSLKCVEVKQSITQRICHASSHGEYHGVAGDRGCTSKGA